MNITTSVRVALAKKGMVQADLARKLDMKSSTLSQVMVSGKCTSTTLERIAGALDMKVSELVKLGEE